jgi:uncharacterized protein YdaU (DUF1376 family)
MSKPPAFMLYASDFDMDTGSWTATQVGVYFRLLMHEWVNGPLPTSMAQLARIARVDVRNMQKMWSAEIAKKFTTDSAGMYVNNRLEYEREKQAIHRELQVKKGEMGAAKRWEGHVATAIAQAQPEHSSSLSLSLSKKETTLVPSGTPPCPHLKIIEQYNQILGPYLAQVKPHLWKGKRAAWLVARWKERESRQSVDWWVGLFERVKNTPFLIGKNDREWKVDLEWIVKESNFVKILEGKYEKKTGRNVVPGNGSGQLRVLDGVPSGTDKGKESNTGPPETHGGQGVEKVTLPLADDGRGRHGEIEEST